MRRRRGMLRGIPSLTLGRRFCVSRTGDVRPLSVKGAEGQQRKVTEARFPPWYNQCHAHNFPFCPVHERARVRPFIARVREIVVN